MPKTISLPNAVYEDLEAIAKELSAAAKKPVSESMTIYLLTEIYRAHMRDPCARDALRQRLAASDLMSPQEFDEACETVAPSNEASEANIKSTTKKKR